jgi:hypothetical protein
MIAPRWRKALRKLWLNKTRTLLVILIDLGQRVCSGRRGPRAILAHDPSIRYEATNKAGMTIMASNLDEHAWSIQHYNTFRRKWPA